MSQRHIADLINHIANKNGDISFQFNLKIYPYTESYVGRWHRFRMSSLISWGKGELRRKFGVDCFREFFWYKKRSVFVIDQYKQSINYERDDDEANNWNHDGVGDLLRHRIYRRTDLGSS
jgi:hypothetical protein